MKNIYFKPFLLFTACFIFYQAAMAQCSSGAQPTGVFYDTTIVFPAGTNSTQIKFPKFDPRNGMLSCVRLVVRMIGVRESMIIENGSTTAATATFNYMRSDQMTGPGLNPNLANSTNVVQGGISLAPSNGVPNSGPDYYAAPPNDTVMSQTMSSTLSDSTAISQFYGTDSITYNYNINVITYISFTGGNGSVALATSALVNFRFEYCTCPFVVLPAGIKNFAAARDGDKTSHLSWEADNGTDNYYYEIEVSTNGYDFTRTAVLPKDEHLAHPSYNHFHGLPDNKKGRWFYRIRQQWLNGAHRYSEIKSVDFSNSLASVVSIYPNPSAGQIGLRFFGARPGRYAVLITNNTGQLVMRTEVNAASTDLRPVTTLQKGVYFVKIIETASGLNCLQQAVVR